MLEKAFLDKFLEDNTDRGSNQSNYSPSDTPAFLKRYGGSSFNQGIYRIHSIKSSDKWTNKIVDEFPKYTNEIQAFGYDWLGRHFCATTVDEELVLMFDGELGDVLRIPVNLEDFHNCELVEYAEDALAESEFSIWMEDAKSAISLEECVGFKTPLSLGGKDEFQNREKVNMDVNWDLVVQLRSKLAPIAKDKIIDQLEIED